MLTCSMPMRSAKCQNSIQFDAQYSIIFFGKSIISDGLAIWMH